MRSYELNNINVQDMYLVTNLNKTFGICAIYDTKKYFDRNRCNKKCHYFAKVSINNVTFALR